MVDSAGSVPVQGGSPIAIPGWYIVELEAKGSLLGDGPRRPGTGWWFSSDAVRIVWSGGRDRKTVTSFERNGDVLHIVAEGASYDLTRRQGGILLKVGGDDAPLSLRDTMGEEARAMEKLDAQLIAKSGDVCARATSCCAAARQKKLANDDDCAAVASTPELSRCARTIERLRKTAAEAGQPLSECAETP